jgi:DNA-binding MarR family transcriptional regulator
MSQVDDPRDDALGRLLLQAHRRAQAASLAKLQQRGHSNVRPGHLPVITNLDAEGTRITELANRAGMTRQMMGRLVRELEELDYVQSRPDPQDQRAVIVTLTERGTRFLGDAPAAIADVERDYAELLGADELAVLRAALVRLITAPPA